MKITTKVTIKLLLVISLFASVSLADDGHMPGGGFSSGVNNVCSVEDQIPVNHVCDQTKKDSDDGHMPGGGRTSSVKQATSENQLLDVILNYIKSIFG